MPNEEYTSPSWGAMPTPTSTSTVSPPFIKASSDHYANIATINNNIPYATLPYPWSVSDIIWISFGNIPAPSTDYAFGIWNADSPPPNPPAFPLVSAGAPPYITVSGIDGNGTTWGIANDLAEGTYFAAVLNGDGSIMTRSDSFTVVESTFSGVNAHYAGGDPITISWSGLTLFDQYFGAYFVMIPRAQDTVGAIGDLYVAAGAPTIFASVFYYTDGTDSTTFHAPNVPGSYLIVQMSTTGALIAAQEFTVP